MNHESILQWWRNHVAGGAKMGGHPSPPDFGRSENGGSSLWAQHYYSPSQIFRPSAIRVLHNYSYLCSTYLFTLLGYQGISYRHSPATAGNLSFWHIKIQVQELSWEAVPSNLGNPRVQKSTGTLGRFTLWICTFWTTYLQTGPLQPWFNTNLRYLWPL